MKGKPLAEFSYEELKDGKIHVKGKDVPTAPLSSYSKAQEIAEILKKWILDKKFYLAEPVFTLPGLESGITFKPLKERPIE